MPNFLASLSPAGTFTAGGTGTINAGNIDFGTNADRAVAVLVTSISGDTAAVISSVVVGGVTLTAGTNIDISNEYGGAGSKGRFFTGTGIPTGSQAVSVNWANPNFVGHHVGYAAMAFDDAITLTITDAGAGTSGTAPTITLTSASGDLMAAFGAWQSDVRATVTAPSTEQFDALATANSGSFYGETQTASTTSTTLAATAASSTGGWRMWGLRVEGAAAAPVITSPTGTATGPTQATIGVTTDTAPGTTTISYQILPAADAAPSASTIVASPTGTITTGSVGALTKAITTLTTNTAVKVHFAQGATSNVVSSSSFTPNTLAIAGTALSSQTGTAGSAFTWSGSTPESLITNTGNGSGSWTATSGVGASGCTVNSTSGILVSSTLGTAGSYTITLQRTDGSTVPSAQTVTKTVGLTISGSGAATEVTISGPSSGAVGVASTNFTVGADGTITGTVVVTPSDSSGGGTFTPSSVSISSGSPTGTFTYTPVSSGAKSITVTNNGSLSNPSALTYTASSSTRTVSFALTTNGTAPAADLSGLKWAFFDEVTPNLFNAPTAQGTGATTDSSGTISITITGTSLTAGQIGWLILTDSNGTVTQNPPAKAFSGPVTIS